MKSWIKCNIVFVAAILLSSCATLISPSKHKSTLITSNVEGAEVFDEKNKRLGTVPYVHKFKPGVLYKDLLVSKEGFSATKVNISQYERTPYVLLGLLGLGLPFVIDYPTRNIYNVRDDSINVILKKEISSDAEKITFVFEPIEWKNRDGDEIGKELKELIYFKKSSFESYMYKDRVYMASKKSAYTLLNSSRGDQFNYIKRPSTIEFKLVIHDLRSDYKKIKGKMMRKVYVDLEWILSQQQGIRIIKRIRDTLTKEVEYEEIKPLLASIIEESVIGVFNDDEIYQKLLLVSKESSVNEITEGSREPISLPIVRTTIFAKPKDMFKQITAAVVTIEHSDGHGSGFFISEDGYLVTNNHVVEGKKMVNVRINESISLSGTVIRSDQIYDLALVKVEGRGFKSIELISSDSVSAGEDVYAVGTPEDISLGQSVTKGIMSGKRKIEDRVFIQTDVAINPGNSGGPLINQEGKVVGMVTLKIVGRGLEGLGFCVPTETILNRLNIKFK